MDCRCCQVHDTVEYAEKEDGALPPCVIYLSALTDVSVVFSMEAVLAHLCDHHRVQYERVLRNAEQYRDRLRAAEGHN